MAVALDSNDELRGLIAGNLRKVLFAGDSSTCTCDSIVGVVSDGLCMSNKGCYVFGKEYTQYVYCNLGSNVVIKTGECQVPSG